MSKKLEAILLENVKDLGQAGDIITVSEGFARNFLFPQGKAALATIQAKADKKQQQLKNKKDIDQATQALQERADLLSRAELSIEAAVKDGDEIFGTITPAVIAKELKKQADIAVKTSQISTEETINKLGTYKVTVNLSPDVEASLLLIVAPKPGTASDAKSEEE